MIYFIDFEDSFNFNILSQLSQIGSVKDIHYRKIRSLVEVVKEGDIVVFGPGPGHVSEYSMAYDVVGELYSKGVFLFGVCLGHQLILSSLFGASIVRSQMPIHGQKVSLADGSGEVMRYNSWQVEARNLNKEHCILDQFGELALYYNQDRVYTLQFHPESVGTSCPEAFFKPLKEFLRYAKADEQFNPIRNL